MVYGRWLSGVALFGLLVLVAAPVDFISGAKPKGPALAPPVVNGPWIVPAPGNNSEPRWGIKGGIALGLWPAVGSGRGLIGIYTPYLGQTFHVLNFMAVEPDTEGHKARGRSELEHSEVDNVAGLSMWSSNEQEKEPAPRNPRQPASGKVVQIDGEAALRVYIYVEEFKNGARPLVEVTFRQNRPHEIGFRLLAAPNSAPIRTCVLTATMGNYARLRRVYLKDSVEEAGKIWSDKKIRGGFAPSFEIKRENMIEKDSDVIVAATPNEPNPAKADYAPKTPPHFHYEGVFATQYWRAPADKPFGARLNGREVYWASHAAVPGGIAFENFELHGRFEDHAEFFFGAIAGEPKGLGIEVKAPPTEKPKP